MIVTTNLYSTNKVAEILGIDKNKMSYLQRVRDSKYYDRFTHKIPKPVQVKSGVPYYNEKGVEQIRIFFKNMTQAEKQIYNFMMSACGKWQGVKY